MKLLALLASVVVLLAVALSADEPPAPPTFAPRTVETPAAAHPRAELLSINVEAQTVCFNWLDAAGGRLDSGNSIVPYAAANPAEPTDAELVAAITAAAPAAP